MRFIGGAAFISWCDPATDHPGGFRASPLFPLQGFSILSPNWGIHQGWGSVFMLALSSEICHTYIQFWHALSVTQLSNMLFSQTFWHWNFDVSFRKSSLIITASYDLHVICRAPVCDSLRFLLTHFSRRLWSLLVVLWVKSVHMVRHLCVFSVLNPCGLSGFQL